MKKSYLEPELLIRKYGISANDIFTTSDLDDDDEYTKPNSNSGGTGGTDMFKD
ncbi:MAG: hypothetical protein IJT65_07645 [Eubacterium sp.]|nr:hypothetical protein [Eubacterium sp.]